MFWKRVILLFVVLHQQQYGTEAICRIGGRKENQTISCNSTDEYELFSFHKKSGSGEWTELIIDNSRFELLRELPPIKEDFEYRYITIKNSNISKIHPDCLRYYPYATLLDFSGNQLEDMDFLRLVSNVDEINFSRNRIKRFDGKVFDEGYIEPKKIDLSFNNITSIDNFRKHRNLVYLNLSHNLITDLTNSFAASTNGNGESRLLRIDLSYNKLKQVSVKDFSNLPSLSALVVSHNNLVDLDSALAQHALLAKGNAITSFDFTNFKGNNIDLSDNRIKEVDIARAELYLFFNVENNRIEKLTTNKARVSRFNLGFNNISDISNLKFHSIDRLFKGDVSLNNNQLKRVDLGLFNELKFIRVLNLSYNPLEIIFRNELRQIKIDTLDLSHCLLRNLDGNIFENISLKSLDLSHNLLTKLPENNMFVNVCPLVLNLGFNPITDFYVSKDLCVRNLFLRGILLKGTEVSQSKIISNQPRNSSFNYNTLKSLSLTTSKNDILDLSLNNLYVKELVITIIDEEIQKNNFAKLISLQKLHIVDSTISNIRKGSFNLLPHLRELHFDHSQISNIEPGAFVGLDRLEYLDIYYLFDSLHVLKPGLFEGLSSLKSLTLSGKEIENVEAGAFIGLDSLDNLDLSFNNIRDLKKNVFDKLKTLSVLDLSNNQLERLDSIGVFKDLSNLKELNLRYNKLTEVSLGVFSNLLNLEHLDLSHNNFQNVNQDWLFSLNKLKYLNLNSNKLSKFEYRIFIEQLPSKQKALIGIGDNNWQCDNLISMLFNMLKSEKIDYKQISVLQFDMKNINGISCVD